MSRKKLHRFLINSPISEGETFEITDECIVHQIGRVLKMHEGEEVSLFSNGSGDVIASIKEISKNALVFQKVGSRVALKPSRTVIAAIAIPKGDTFELIVQKLTELGVSQIVPLITSRTIKQSVRLDRLQTISDEAVEQCGGSTRVSIHEPISLSDCLKAFPFASIAFEPGTSDTFTPADTVVMYVGPEGGWSEDDMQVLRDHQVVWLGLGERILRTETAAIVGVFSILSL